MIDDFGPPCLKKGVIILDDFFKVLIPIFLFENNISTLFNSTLELTLVRSGALCGGC
jgi:hypothetical protein